MATPRIRQDVPPPGGFESVEKTLLRNLPVRGPSAAVLFGVAAAVIVWGQSKLRAGLRLEEEWKDERERARLHLIPLLQAEADRRYLRYRAARDKIEAEIMKDVPGISFPVCFRDLTFGHSPGWKVGEQLYKTRWGPDYHNRRDNTKKKSLFKTVYY